MYKITMMQFFKMSCALLLLASSNLYAQVDLALNKIVSASTVIQPAANAVDGNATTRWESAFNTDPSWISVDLGNQYALTSIVIDWEAANAATYQIQGSINGTTWVTLVTKTGGTFGNRTDTTGVSGNYRHVRIYGTARSVGNQWGYSIWSLKVYGGAVPVSSSSSATASSTPANTNLALNRITAASTTVQTSANVVDGNATTRWESAYGVDPSWISVDLGSAKTLSSVVIDWEAANAASYQVQGSNDNANWTTLAARNGGAFGNRTDTNVVSGSYRYVRIYGTARSVGNNWGYSIYELKVFGSAGASSASSASSRPTIVSAFTQIEAENFTTQVGIQTEISTEAGSNVGWIDTGDYLSFQAVDFGSGAKAMSARVASGGAGGVIEIRSGSANGSLLGSCTVIATGGWQVWSTVTCPIANITGVQTLYLRFTGTGTGGLFNLNWFKFSTVPLTTGDDVVGKIIVGYQGWFNAIGDGSPFGCWFHWSNNCNAPTPNTNVKFELYPDTREYSKLYQSNLAALANGAPARLFSSYDQETVNKHFEWMQTYGIDGAALQRFGADESDAVSGYKSNRDIVAVKVKNAAETYSRKFYVMYDITGLNANWVAAIKHDWNTQVINNLQLTFSSSYARQNGKIVVCIWGIGFTHTPGTAAETAELISWFKSQNVYVIGGVPTYWRTGINDSKPGFLDAFKSLDMISPWLVGRFGGIDGADNFKLNLLSGDFALTQQIGKVYQPVIWPGFAWSNMYPENPRNQIPRLHGDFMWRQAYNMKSLGINTGYVAMFDEYDEGTAIAKGAENSSMIPNNQYFLTLDADGVAVSADFYLRLTRDITRLFKSEIPITVEHPTSHQ